MVPFHPQLCTFGLECFSLPCPSLALPIFCFSSSLEEVCSIHVSRHHFLLEIRFDYHCPGHCWVCPSRLPQHPGQPGFFSSSVVSDLVTGTAPFPSHPLRIQHSAWNITDIKSTSVEQMLRCEVDLCFSISVECVSRKSKCFIYFSGFFGLKNNICIPLANTRKGFSERVKCVGFRIRKS